MWHKNRHVRSYRGQGGHKTDQEEGLAEGTLAATRSKCGRRHQRAIGLDRRTRQRAIGLDAHACGITPSERAADTNEEPLEEPVRIHFGVSGKAHAEAIKCVNVEACQPG